VTPWTALAIAGAGFAAGMINTIVGSGSLITFPTLLGLGYAPVVANVTNTVGLFPGSISGAVGYRRELAGQRDRAVWLSVVGALGGVAGGGLLLALPGTVFESVVPFLVIVACGLIAAQPRLTRWMQGRGAGGSRTPMLAGTVFGTAVYGGYFGAAQGVILIALFAILLTDGLQRLNALKNVVAATVNLAAAVLFAIASHVAWAAAGLLAAGAVAGGQVGALVGRRLPAWVLRGVIVVVGLVVAGELLARYH
jgi:uncharacterized membrane protein YfcA